MGREEEIHKELASIDLRISRASDEMRDSAVTFIGFIFFTALITLAVKILPNASVVDAFTNRATIWVIFMFCWLMLPPLIELIGLYIKRWKLSREYSELQNKRRK